MVLARKIFPGNSVASSTGDPITFPAMTGAYKWDWLINGRSIAAKLTGDTTITLANQNTSVTAFLEVEQDATAGRSLTITGAGVIDIK